MKVARMPRPGRRGAPHDRGPGAVAEEDGGGAVLEVGDGRELLRPDHEHRLALPRRDEALGHGERVHVARARRADVEGRGVLGAEQRLEIAGGGREQPVGAGGGEHDGVELDRRDAGRGHGAARSPPGSACATVSSGRAMWRSRMPVRSTIQSSDVSSIRLRSSLVRTPGGTATPTLATSANGRAIMIAPRARAARTRPRYAR